MALPRGHDPPASVKSQASKECPGARGGLAAAKSRKVRDRQPNLEASTSQLRNRNRNRNKSRLEHEPEHSTTLCYCAQQGLAEGCCAAHHFAVLGNNSLRGTFAPAHDTYNGKWADTSSIEIGPSSGSAAIRSVAPVSQLGTPVIPVPSYLGGMVRARHQELGSGLSALSVSLCLSLSRSLGGRGTRD